MGAPMGAPMGDPWGPGRPARGPGPRPVRLGPQGPLNSVRPGPQGPAPCACLPQSNPVLAVQIADSAIINQQSSWRPEADFWKVWGAKPPKNGGSGGRSPQENSQKSMDFASLRYNRAFVVAI